MNNESIRASAPADPSRAQAARRIVVTGAGEGMRAAVALRLLRQGAQVHGLARTAQGLQRVADAASIDSGLGGRFVPHRVDLADRVETDRTADMLVDALEGRCDALVNNAGISTVRPFPESDDSMLDALFAVNFFAAFQVTRRLVAALPARRRGSVVNIASDLALIGPTRCCAYPSTKSAIPAR